MKNHIEDLPQKSADGEVVVVGPMQGTKEELFDVAI